jgi:Type VI secretion system/phage-baseplate injector OB domain
MLDDRPKSGVNPQTAPNLKKIHVDPGPYEATILEHIAESRSGEVYVYIPELSGPMPGLASIKVSYASPFYGKTFGSDSQEYANTTDRAGQSYGMWMVPPDIGTTVLVMFVAGDRNRGYWFACPYNSTSHEMVPGISRNIGNQTLDPTTTFLAEAAGSDSNLPVTEYSTNKQSNPTAFTDYVNSPRPTHEYQAAVLISQGLDRDKIRGAISSSSMRESPSTVFGISTPGRRATKGNQVSGNPEAVFYRTGGHSFVMDDGADGSGQEPEGTDQLIRLRTSGGHQILMNDTEHIIYIASKTGNQWLEFSADGSINVYGAAGFNLRSEGPINMHSDTVIKMNAKAIQMNGSEAVVATSDGIFSAYGSSSASVTAGGGVSIKGATVGVNGEGIVTVKAGGLCMINGAMLMLNCGGAAGMAAGAVTGALGGGGGPAQTHDVQDTARLANGLWAPVPGYIDTICTVVPAHEPWVQDDGKSRPEPEK